MQPLKVLTQWMTQKTGPRHYMFSNTDLKALFPNMSETAYKSLLSRAASSGLLTRVCRGLYIYEPAIPKDGLALYRIAGKLRPNNFNYLSLETVLSEAGVISQVPFSWICVMSTGRSSTISCGKFGTIEYIHTKRIPDDLAKDIVFDQRCGIWRASVPLAIKDMKLTGRSLDLIDWDIANEYT